MKLGPGDYFETGKLTDLDAYKLLELFKANGVEMPGFPHSYWRARDRIVILNWNGVLTGRYQDGNINAGWLGREVELPSVDTAEVRKHLANAYHSLEKAFKALGEIE